MSNVKSHHVLLSMVIKQKVNKATNQQISIRKESDVSEPAEEVEKFNDDDAW